MAHAQNSPRGLFAKNRVDIGDHNFTANSSAVLLSGGLAVDSVTTVPTTRYYPGALVYVTNSTGTMIALNTTGTTWTYLNVTSVLA